MSRLLTTRQTLNLLRQYESPNVTFFDPDGSWPIVWERARGVHVWDAEGGKYLDLTAAFGVAAAGHANPRVVGAGQKQMARLLHAMGDVHPHALKAVLAREISALTFERWYRSDFKFQISNLKSRSGKTIFCNSGFEAVEAALKTAALATGKSGIIAFQGAYHGLGYGALNATHREHFRNPFLTQLGQFGHFVPFPAKDSELIALSKQISAQLAKKKIGAILVEPIQVRGGVNIPPFGFLPLLRRLCDRFRALLILDEIYTGFGRTGKWFACEHSQTVPDLICLGKALTGGFPLSACVGRADVMDKAWPVSQGEAIHTSTFLGHPVGCAMALAQIDEIKRLKLIQRSAAVGKSLMSLLESQISNREFEIRNSNSRSSIFDLQLATRGTGLLAAVELTDAKGNPATDLALNTIKLMLKKGYILLPEGEHSNIISLAPPLTISEDQLIGAVRALFQVLKQLSRE